MNFEAKQSAATLLQFSILPIGKVLVMCTLGFLIATPYVGILCASARKQLTKLVFSLFLPSLIFTQLGMAVTLEKILEWWFIPVNVILGAVIGCAVGFVVAVLVKPPPQFFHFTVIMIGIGNIGNIPLVIIGAICRDSGNPFGDSDSCNNKGVAYISFGQWVGAVIVYTFVYRMLVPPVSEQTMSDSKDIEQAQNSHTLTFEHTNGADVHLCNNFFADNVHAPLLLKNTSGKVKKGIRWLQSCLGGVRLQDILQPPVVASLLALFIGAIPPLKQLVFNEHAILIFVSDSLSIMGGAMIPCIMLVLGGNLVGGAESSQLGLRTTVAIVVTRLLLMPVAGIAVVFTADKLGFLPVDDKMFRFVLLLQHTMPTSILAGAVANLQGHAVKEASAILFYEHIFAVLSMTGWLILFFNVLF